MKLTSCRRCPRLVAWREEAARNPPRRFAGERYWSKPVPAFGERGSPILLVGLAPAAHGANRTGRMFTGDESGTFLFARSPRGRAREPADAPFRRRRRPGSRGALLTAVCRCAPPDNRPRPTEIENCRGYLAADFAAMARPRVLVALGALAFGACLASSRGRGRDPARRRSRGFRTERASDRRGLAARDLPSEPAEHVHGSADAADAARGAAPRGEAREPSAVTRRAMIVGVASYS